jgi:hypothetical protein
MTYLKGLGMGGKIILKWNFGEMECVGVSWIHTAEHKDQC